MKWVDSHAHLNDEAFKGDILGVIERARDSGIGWIVVPGYDLSSSVRAIELAHRFPEFLYAAVGWHPHDAKGTSEREWKELMGLLDDDGVVAIGETGLDFYKEYSPREDQRELLRRHIDLALEREMPLILHTRRAFRDVFHILEEYPSLKGVFHCFSGGLEEARRATRMGFYVSFSGSITFGGERLRSALMEVEEEKLLIETDAPYLAPHPHRGRRNEPSFLPLIGEKVKEVLNLSLERVQEITSLNAETLFLSPRKE